MFANGEEIIVTTRVPQVDGDGNPVTDSYGNATFTDTTAEVLGAFAPSSGTEQTSGQDQVVTQPTAYLPAGTIVSPTSKLTIRGLDYEVNGAPASWRSPFTGRHPGIEVPLKRIAG